MVLRDLQTAGIAIAEETILARPGSYRLLDQQLEGRLLKPRAAWITELNGSKENVKVIVCVDQRFPFSLPKVYLTQNMQAVPRPHVNSQGKICLVTGNPGFAYRDPRSVTEWALKSAEQILEAPDPILARQDFIDEFDAYWAEIAEPGKSALTLFVPDQSSRQLFYWSTDERMVLSDSRQKLKQWLRNSQWHKGEFRFRRGVYLWLPDPVTASEFPKNGYELQKLFARYPSELELLSAAVPQDEPGALTVVVGFNTNNGVALATVVLHEPMISLGPSKTKLLVEDGFSKRSHIPLKLLSSRYLTNAKLTGLATRRFDLDWQDYRTGNSLSKTLRNKRVCVIGCGALGSHVAYGLAKAGVGKLVLIDYDRLTSDNTRRHLLGMEYIGRKKVNAVKNFIQKQLPDIEITALASQWEDEFESNAEFFVQSDIVISTTGEWSCEEALNLVKFTHSSMPATIFSCMETLGLSGQALAVVGDGGCHSCATNPTGRSYYESTIWLADTKKQVGACGDQFQPFGFPEVGPVSDLVVRLAIDVLSGRVKNSELRVWIGDIPTIEEAGGQISRKLIELVSGEIRSNSSFAVTFAKREDCNLCSA